MPPLFAEWVLKLRVPPVDPLGMIDSSTERRGLQRSVRRLACDVEIEGVSTKAVILNLTVRGVFVRTNAKAQVGAPAVLRMRRPGGEIWELQAEVAHFPDRDQAPAWVRGLGLEIISAPPGFEEFVAELRR